MSPEEPNIRRLHARHRTELTYGGTARESVNEARLVPRSSTRQRVEHASLRVEPESELSSHRDAFGNEVRWFQIAEPHERLVVEAEAVVVVGPAPARPPASDPEGQWAALGTPAYADALAEHLAPSALVRWPEEVTELAAAMEISRGGGVAGWLEGLERSVHQALVYDQDATRVDTPVADVARARRGVCQDFAHLSIAICRQAGIAARYVSGWLFRPDGREPGESHAWMEANVPGEGWVELDATHPGAPRDHYIRLAVGRDYRDVAPLRGSYVGALTERMTVSVEVSELAVTGVS
jgi:transglutaminase-like putative cysteine protease